MISANILGGDLEIDSMIDVNDELNKLESEVLLDMSMVLPDVPSEVDNLHYVSDDDVEGENDIKIKQKLEAEIEKLRRELEE